jgi:archaellum component FlaC
MLTSITTNGDGTFQTRITIPTDAQGPHRIFALTTTGAETETSFTVTPQVRASLPNGFISVLAGAQGQSITLSGTGFPSGATIAANTITVQGTAFDGTSITSPTTNPGISVSSMGSFSATPVTISQPLPEGFDYHVLVQVSTQQVVSDQGFLASKPTIGQFLVKPLPSSGFVGDSLNFRGLDFSVYAGVGVFFVLGPPSLPTSITSVFSTTADPNGAVQSTPTLTFPVPHLSQAVYSIFVKDQSTTPLPTSKNVGSFAIVPKVVVTPDTQSVGQMITVSGTGFPSPFTAGFVSIGGVLSLLSLPAASTPFGDWGPNSTMVPHVSGGGTQVPVVVIGVDTVTSFRGTVAVKPSLVGVKALTLSGFSPGSFGNAGDLLQVSGTGYLAGETVTTQFQTSTAIQQGTVTSGGISPANGDLQALVVVPGISPDLYTLTVAGSTPTNTAITPFTVERLGFITKLFVNLDLTSGLSISSNLIVGNKMTLRGTGFAGSSASFSIDGVPILRSASVDSFGFFGTSLTIPPLTRGTHGINALGFSSASSLFSITPNLTLSTEAANVGTTVSLAGTGFGATETVDVSWDKLIPLGSTTTDPTGSFTASFKVPASPAGAHLVITSVSESPFAVFNVLPRRALEITADVSSMQFPGEAAIVYVSTTLDGTPTDVNLSTTLFYPNSTSTQMSPVRLQTGLYKVQFNIPGAGKAQIGSYAFLMKASDSDSNATAVKSFQVSSALPDLMTKIVSIADMTANLQTSVGNVAIDLNQVNATVRSINGNTVTINSAIGTMQGDINSIMPEITSIQGDTATIKTTVGTVNTNVNNIMPEITSIQGDTATIKTTVGTVNTNVNNIMPEITSIQGDTATIKTSVGTINTNVNTIMPQLTKIQGDTATITTTVGTINTSVNSIMPQITKIQGDTATISTTVGTINTSVSALSPQVTSIQGNIATVNTSVGTLTGKIDSISGNVATISTNVGTLQAQVGGQNVPTVTNYALLASILSGLALVFAVTAVAVILRKVK